MKMFPDISLSFGNVGAERGGNSLFTDLSFKISSNEVVWIQGANGIGKTTLLRLAAGLSQPETGAVFWQKGEHRVLPNAICAFQGHRNALKANLSVSEDLRFWAEIYDHESDIIGILKSVGLSERANVPCRNLSAGQARRLAIARLLVSGKPLWIMDEPAAAMDIEGQALILDVVNKHIAKGGAALIASHDTIRPFSGRTSLLTLESV